MSELFKIESSDVHSTCTSACKAKKLSAPTSAPSRRALHDRTAAKQPLRGHALRDRAPVSARKLLQASETNNLDAITQSLNSVH
jgi:hypothetical protein